jgi:FHS family L-fucose permease-like MFS transporter
MSNNRSLVSPQYLVAFILVTSLFFLWAFLHNSNPILIPHLTKALQLTDTQSSLVDFAVYIGYFTIALPAGWFMHKYGYKKGVLFGLTLYAAGALLFLPASSSRSYMLFLVALFIIASGATFLETVANPYITKLGPPATSEQRLNLAQSFNGVGAVMAPIIGGKFILSGVEHTKEQLAAMTPTQLNAYLQTEADTIKIPYLVIGIVVLLVAFAFFVTRIPEIKESDSDGGHGSFSLRIFRHQHVTWAVIAQLFYVGAQVCVGSYFVKFTRTVMNMPEKDAADVWGYIAMGGFMAGRFAGTWLMRYIKPSTLLVLYSLISILLLAIALTTEGKVAVYCVVAVPFFESIMFPTIFALGIKNLGEESKIASSFLVMAIVGGAIFPPMMGVISDKTGSIQNAYIIPLLCFIVTFYFGWRGYKIKPVNHVPAR